MEEIVQALVEQGAFNRDRNVGADLRVGPPVATPGAHTGAPLHMKSLADLHLPPTVQAVLASRIDRLQPEAKELLQTLAVVGKTFSLSLLKQVADHSEDTLHRLLARLRDAEFIYEQPAFPEPDYTFKHALTQEVAYNSMLVERRKVLHERAAQAIETLFHNRLDDQYSELASHYSRSGNTQKGIDYLQLAGQQAGQQSANAEAITHLTTALELLETLPSTPEHDRQELTLQIALGGPLQATQGLASSQAERAYIRARELCQQLGETLQLLPVLLGLGTCYLQQGKLYAAQELGEQGLTLAQSLQDPAILLKGAIPMLGMSSFFLGEVTQAWEYLERGISLYNPQLHDPLTFHYWCDPGVLCRSFAAKTLRLLGYPDQALQRNREALTFAQELSHPQSMAFALYAAGVLHHFLREGQVTQERAEAEIALAHEQRFPLWSAWGTMLRGCALSELGQGEEGIAQIRDGLAAFRATGSGLLLPYCLALLAEAYGKEGQVEEGLTVLAEAQVEVEKTGERFYEAELYRLKGELTLQSKASLGQVKNKSKASQKKSEDPNPQYPTPSTQAEAEACFLQAIAIAQKQQAKSLELRAVMSLVRLRQRQAAQDASRTTHHAPRARLDLAHSMLSDLYNWFTEGFDTKDLQEAKALLGELEGKKTKRQGLRKTRTPKQR